MVTTFKQKINLLYDIEEIKKLQYRYVNSLVFGRWDDVIDCFAEDAVTDMKRGGITKGKQAIARLFKEGISQGHGRGEGALVVHPVIEVDGDNAKGSWLIYFMFADSTSGKASDWAMGTYDMDYIREHDEWKIAKMKVQMLLGLPSRGDYLEKYVAGQSKTQKNI